MSNFRYLNRDQLNDVPDLEPMIEGVLDKGTVVVLAAQSGAGKTFLALDWALSYATERPWQGRNTDNLLRYPDDRPGPGKSLYIAAEGVPSLKHRIGAWEKAWQRSVSPDKFVALEGTVQLGSLNEVAMLCADLEMETYGLVVIDTLARCSLGLEENSAMDMGRVIDAAYRIRKAMGPDGTVVLVHHLGKSGVVRGSSALLSGVDQLMTLERDGDTLVLEDEKRKDGPEMEPIALHLASKFGSCVIEAATPGMEQGNPLVEHMRVLTDILPMTKTELRNATEIPDRSFYRHLSNGIRDGLIVASDEKNPRYSLSTGLKSEAR